jgi:20S proteasome subunit beta 1
MVVRMDADDSLLLQQQSATAAASTGAAAAEVDLGTTLVAIKFDTGVVVGADTRTSVGAYVSHRSAHKIVPVSDAVVIARSGSAAETQQLATQAQLFQDARLHRYGSSMSSKPLSVSQIAHWLRGNIYDENQAAVGLLVAGCDSSGEPQIFSISPTGALLEERGSFAVAGSGSTFVLGLLDDHFGTDLCDGFDEPSAIEMCRRAIELSINRDGSSGGFIRMHVVTASGRRELTIFPERSSKSDARLPGFVDAVHSSSNSME